jgi:Tol biopolymer transport system component
MAAVAYFRLTDEGGAMEKLDLGGRMSVAAQKLIPGGPFRSIEGHVSQLRVIDRATGVDRALLETLDLIEAPNWMPDGKTILLNGRGGMFRLDLEQGATLEAIDIGSVEDANNDHVISPDGRTLYISAGGAVYAVPVEGGEPYQLTSEGGMRFFLHGVSPDGQWLACTTIDMGSESDRWGIQRIRAQGGEAEPLLLGPKPVDGPEWSPDGQWIWFSGELEADVPGHAQIFRMRSDGTDVRRMVHSPAVDWFPHPSPDGLEIAFIRYPVGTTGHPPDKQVEIWRMIIADGAMTRLAAFRGGQGSFNVNSWSPDGGSLAYVAYPVVDEASERAR